MKKEFPEWAKIAYRGVRSAVAAGIAQTVLLRPDLSNPEESLKMLSVAFLAGFIPALGMFLRDWLDSAFGLDEKSTIQKTMPF